MGKAREKTIDSGEYLPSLIRLRLLILCKDFQRTAMDIRNRYDVPQEGLVWLKNFSESLGKKTSWEDLTKYNKEFEKHKNLIYESNLHDDVGGRTKKTSGFQIVMGKVAEKYNLPYSLIERSFSGVPYYILTNEIKVDRAYEIHPRLATEQGDVGWVNVRIYEKMKMKQLYDMAEKIYKLQDQYFSKALKLNVSQRKQIVRDLELTETLLKREHKPRTVKEYDSVYLTQLKKSGASKKEILKAEKKSRASVKKSFDQITSKQLGKTNEMESDAVRSAKKRLNTLAKQWFGYSLDV